MKNFVPGLFSQNETQIFAGRMDAVGSAPARRIKPLPTDLSFEDNLFDEDDLKFLDQVIATGILIY